MTLVTRGVVPSSSEVPALETMFRWKHLQDDGALAGLDVVVPQDLRVLEVDGRVAIVDVLDALLQVVEDNYLRRAPQLPKCLLVQRAPDRGARRHRQQPHRLARPTERHRG